MVFAPARLLIAGGASVFHGLDIATTRDVPRKRFGAMRLLCAYPDTKKTSFHNEVFQILNYNITNKKRTK